MSKNNSICHSGCIAFLTVFACVGTSVIVTLTAVFGFVFFDNLIGGLLAAMVVFFVIVGGVHLSRKKKLEKPCDVLDKSDRNDNDKMRP